MDREKNPKEGSSLKDRLTWKEGDLIYDKSKSTGVKLFPEEEEESEDGKGDDPLP